MQALNSSPPLEMSLQRGSGPPNRQGKEGNASAAQIPVITEIRKESFQKEAQLRNSLGAEP